jgi:acyl transferase domain-containing protein/phosphopantetheinyl transferase (holo-ACP synthase)
MSTKEKIAIIGMSCLFPEAPNLASFWRNIVTGRDSIRQASDAEWEILGSDLPNFDPYCKQGGFVTDLATFDPMKFGIMPTGIHGADPEQFLALKTAHQALVDAGYADKDFNREKAEVILGRISAPAVGALNFIQHNQTVEEVIKILHSLHPELEQNQLTEIAKQLRQSLPASNPESAPSIMPNVLAGRIANKLDFRGRSLILDAACASSLVAVEIAVQDLLARDADLALAGGLHINSNKYFYHLFCSLGALSHKGKIRPFDNEADGTLLGEGIGMIVLKRLDEAIADGDRVYATICGTGTSSDGRGASVLAPTVEGESLAIRRAYEMSQFSPQSVGHLEAHGTGTIEGDFVELKAIETVFSSQAKDTSTPWLALGSVKSNIGHCQAASGVAGIIKSALSLYHRVLPPTLNVAKPNAKIDWSKSPCYINSTARPWIHPAFKGTLPEALKIKNNKITPRRAAVSAFGFGGINAHCVLEEVSLADEFKQETLLQEWPSELFAFQGDSAAELISKLEDVAHFCQLNKKASLKDIAFTVQSDNQSSTKTNQLRVALVAESIDDLLSKIAFAINKLAQVNSDTSTPGVYFSGTSQGDKGKVAYLLPGLGAAYPHMLADLCIYFPEVREVFDYIDLLALSLNEQGQPSKKLFPPTDFNGTKSTAADLASMDFAVVAVLMAEYAIYRILLGLGMEPDCVMGCSTGEFGALVMSGAVDILDTAPMFYKQSTRVARAVPKENLDKLRSIMVLSHYEKVAPHLQGLNDSIYLTADLSPHQLILTASIAAMEQATQSLRDNKIPFHPLPAAIPYHTSLVKDAVSANDQDVQNLDIKTPVTQAWACSSAQQIPNSSAELRKLAITLFEKPIQLRKTIEAMYQDGVRTFVEIGPKNTLTELVGDILSGKPHIALATNYSNKSSLNQLHQVIAKLFALGVSMDLTSFFVRRKPVLLNFKAIEPLSPESKSSIKLSLKVPSPKLSNPQSFLPKATQSFAPPSPDAGANVSIDAADLIMENYLENLTAFHKQMMAVQQNVLTAYTIQQPEYAGQPTATINQEINLLQTISQAIAEPPLQSEMLSLAQLPTQAILTQPEYYVAEPQFKPLPFMRNATIQLSSHSSTAKIELSLQEHRYLLDHAIGNYVTSQPNRSERVYLLPLMVALEIMAESAATLMPGQQIARLENVRAYKRIRVGTRTLPLDVTARVSPSKPGHIEVEILSPSSNTCLMSCHVVFNSISMPNVGMDIPPEHKPLVIPKARPAKLSPTNLYGPKAMFHGRAMQSVLGIEQVGERQITGTVLVRQPLNWFTSDPEMSQTSDFLIDPLLLDNASQLVLFHLFEHELNVSALLPFHIESIKFFDSTKAIGQERARVEAHLSSLGEQGTEARVDIIGESGNLKVQIDLINSKRIQLTDLWRNFIEKPATIFLATINEEPTSKLPKANNWVFARFNDTEVPSDQATLEWCADYVLTESERHYLSQESKLQKRKREWLAGRIAAKDAIRTLIMKHHQIELCPADIEILHDDHGKPIANGWWKEKIGYAPQVSIAHADRQAVALAGLPDDQFHPGVDTEPVRSRGPAFEGMAFTKDEMAKIESTGADERESTITHFWCAKEALAKSLSAIGTPHPQELEVVDFNWTTRKIILRFKQDDSKAQQYLVHSHYNDDVILALTVGETIRSHNEE